MPMESMYDLNVFLQPASVAVIGATERPGSWGSFIMEGLISWNYPGKIYPVNPNANAVYGIPAFRDVTDIPGPVELAVLTIPSESVEKAIRACGLKGVRGITIVTAGFGEAIPGGRKIETALAEIAHSFGMRLVGPNVSGTFNLHARFSAAASTGGRLLPTSLAAVTQGGYAFYELLASAQIRGMGVGKFIHTGNECDLTVTDFLEHFGRDPEVTAIIMYLETIRDGSRFLDVARRITKTKPVVVHKAGRTGGGARAARSHTGALAVSKEVLSGLLSQAGVIISPTMELLVPLGHALLEHAPMRGNRVAIVTMGGSWGVVLSDFLEEQGLRVVELSPALQKRLRDLGMPIRASMRNPVDLGASGMFTDVNAITSIAREILHSNEIDALILHGMGRPGMVHEESPPEMKFMLDLEKQIIRSYVALGRERGLPVIIGNHSGPLESQVVSDLTRENIRIYNRIDEIACILSSLNQYWTYRESR